MEPKQERLQNGWQRYKKLQEGKDRFRGFLRNLELNIDYQENSKENGTGIKRMFAEKIIKWSTQVIEYWLLII